jgi:hypothetical protein
MIVNIKGVLDLYLSRAPQPEMFHEKHSGRKDIKPVQRDFNAFSSLRLEIAPCFHYTIPSCIPIKDIEAEGIFPRPPVGEDKNPELTEIIKKDLNR